MAYFKNIQTIKKMLIKYYKEYFLDSDLLKYLYKKWINENKENYINDYNKKIITLEDIISDETYNITETDILLLSYYLKIPIIIYYQSKNKIKLSNFKQNNIDNDEYYFIKATNKNVFYLHTYSKKIIFKKSKLHQELQTAIDENSYENFEDYLKTKIRK